MLIKQQNYLQFLGLLMPGCVTNEETLENLRVYEEWIDSATDEEIREKAQFHYDLWDKLVQEWQADFNPKVPWEEIERDIQELSKDPALSWSEGPIQYGWLAQRINCSILGLPGDLPYHANIGAGYQALGIFTEEDMMLRDAFFLLVKARQSLKRFITSIRNAEKNGKSIEEIFEMHNDLGESVATYSRLTVFAFYSFVECFINSIGWDYLIRNPGLPSDQEIILKGCEVRKNKPSYVNLIKKIERIPGIIRRDGKCYLLISDPAQIKEPFKSFNHVVKDIRDATTHYSKQKANIWRGPAEWVKIANESCKICMECACSFWSACYPGRGLPIYLEELDSSKYIAIAKKRIKYEEIVN